MELSPELRLEIEQFAGRERPGVRELAFLLKGEKRLIPRRFYKNLPSWTGILSNLHTQKVLEIASRTVGLDSKVKKEMTGRLVSYLSTPIEAASSLNKVQLDKVKKSVGERVFDLLVDYLPDKYEKRVLATHSRMMVPGESVTLCGKVQVWKKPFSNRAPWTMELDLGGSSVQITFFGKVGYSYSNQFPSGTEVIVSGTVDARSFVPNLVNPEIFRYDSVWRELLSGYVPHYRKISGVSSLSMLRIMRDLVLGLAKHGGEWIPEPIIERYGFPSLVDSIINIHFPSLDVPEDDLFEKETNFHKRLAFDKLFFFQCAALLQRRSDRSDKGRKVKPEGRMATDVEKNLPFALTGAQARVLKEIRADLSSSEPMSRLLQGDVGSGKTVVMLLSALDVVESGYRAVIMAPTEILARQHYDSVEKFMGKGETDVALVVGGKTGNKRKQQMEAASEARLIIGTHALYENLDQMDDLGLIIVDEQHRFGVGQRMKLLEKGTRPDLLVVSATPIPRSLALTMYGGVDISVLNEIPPGRKPIKTRYVPYVRRQKVFDYVNEIVQDQGKRGYWVCPLVEESETMDLVDVQTVYDQFRHYLGDRVQLLHGRMKGEEKERIIGMLRDGTAGLLISTVVVEVGVDIPDASFMVIENAERFGLAQLHQLRGRVGRGSIQSFAALIGGEKVTGKAEERLIFMQNNRDGFRVAEFDLKQRGPGALTGLEQSGFKQDPSYMLAARYGIEVQKARNSARSLYADDLFTEEEKKSVERVLKKFFSEAFERFRVG